MTRIPALLACLGTLPYLTLKILWLTGNPVGLTDPALVSSTSMLVLNAATVGMDLAVVVLAVALTHARGRRLPAVAVLLPAWVATGLLGPIALAGLPAAVVAAVSGGPANGMAGWVRPMVYGGFTWQAVFLLLAFALYARRRWAATVRRVGAPSPLLRVTVTGGVLVAVLSAALEVLGGTLSGSGYALAGGLANAMFALAGAAGVRALATGRATGRARTAALVAGWCGSAALFAGGLWIAVTTMGATDLAVTGDPAVGMASLTGLLAGFALAVAGLLSIDAATAPGRAGCVDA